MTDSNERTNEDSEPLTPCFDCVNDTNHVDIRIEGYIELIGGSAYWIGANPSLESREDIRQNPPGLNETRHTCGPFAVYLELIGGRSQCMEIFQTLAEARDYLTDADAEAANY